MTDIFKKLENDQYENIKERDALMDDLFLLFKKHADEEELELFPKLKNSLSSAGKFLFLWFPFMINVTSYVYLVKF